MDEVYTKGQIHQAWQEYQSRKILIVKKDGKDSWSFLSGPIGKIDGTAAKIGKIKDEISFPKYLEKYYYG